MKKFMCKALLNREKTSNAGSDWAAAKRSILIMDDDSMRVGNLEIEFSRIRNAKLRIVPSAFFLPGCILSVILENETHHFGLSYSRYWKGELPFQVERIRVKVPFIWLRRAFILGMIGYLFYSIFKDIFL